MAGRRRRGTTSSTESVVLDQLRYRQESTVLKPVSADSLEDDWPTFELEDAVILNKDGRRVENMLDVIFNGPFIVRGRMLVEDEGQRKHLVSRVRAPVPIEIWPCQRYSIGETEGGNFEEDEAENEDADARPMVSVLWVSGQGGWFEVKPSPAYVPIYRDMCDAIKLFYAFYDIYSRADPKFRKGDNGMSDPTERLAPLFLKYAVRVGSGITIQEVERRCLDIAPFLISQFLDDINFWKKTYLYQWFKETHRDIFSKVSHSKRNPKPVDADEQRQRASATLPSRPRNESSTPVREKFDASHRSSSRTRSTRSTSTALGTQTHVQTQVSTPAAATSVKRSPRDATGAQAAIHTGDVQNETDNRPSPRLLKKETPTTEEEASPFESLFSFFQATIDELAGSRKGITLSSIANKIYFNHKFPNYRNGQTGCHRIPVEELLHYNAKELLTRIDPKYRDTEVYAWLEEKSTADFNPIAIKLSDFPYPLIPRNARQKPAAQRGQKGLPNANHTDSSLDRESTPVDRLETPRAGKGLKRRPKKSSLRLTSSKKRPFSEVESGSESDDSRGETKKSHFFQDPDESMEEVADDNDDNTTHEPENAVRIVIQAEKMPSSVPRGHHGAWTCEHDDCDYIVRGGDEEECQARISAHFEHHEQQAERVQLAITEGTRGHNQINNLLEKIKRLGEQQQQEAQPQAAQRNGVVVPQPIKTNLIV